MLKEIEEQYRYVDDRESQYLREDIFDLVTGLIDAVFLIEFDHSGQVGPYLINIPLNIIWRNRVHGISFHV